MKEHMKWRYQVRLDKCEFCEGDTSKPCFFFVADCHGDSIAICAKHLDEILKEVRGLATCVIKDE